MKKTLFASLALLSLFSLPLRADLRDYLRLYKPYAIPQGEIEFEFWTDLRNPDQGSSYLWHQTEVEYGLRSDWTTAFYGVFQEGLGFTGVKWANRFYLGQYLTPWLFDSGLYVELIKANDSKMPDELEVKFLANKKYGDFDFTANPILELEREIEIKNGKKEKEWELEGSFLAGCTHPWPSLFKKLGLQDSKAAVELELGKHIYLIPQLNLTLKPFVRLNIGPALGLNPGADNWRLKSILEVEF